MTFELGPGGIRRALDAALTSHPSIPGEPTVGSVVQFKIKHGKRLYDYAAIRAGDGKWYTTGESKQGVDWKTMCDAIKPLLVGPMWIMTGRQGFTL